MTTSIALFTLCCASSQQPALNEHYRAWLKPLSAFAKAEGATMCVDVDSLARPALFHYPKREGIEGLDRLACATGRSWSVIDGAYVFKRSLTYDDARLKSPQSHVLSYLTSLSTEDLVALHEESQRLSLAPRTGRQSLRFAVASLGEGLGDSLLAHFPGRVGMRLLLEPTAYVVSRTGDGEVNVNLVEETGTITVPESRFAESEPSPLGGPLSGDLDFGEGSIMTLGEIAQIARATFGKQIWIDGRLDETTYFISGRYTLERMLSVLEAVSEPLRPQIVPESPTSTSALNGLNEIKSKAFSKSLKNKIGAGDLTYSDVLGGVDTTFEDIYGDKVPRHVRSFMSQYRIQPTDAVRVKGVVSMAFAAPGIASIPSDMIDGRGQPIMVAKSHFLKVLLEPAR